MSITPTIKRALRRGGGAASVWLPPDRGPDAWQHLVGRARVAEGRRRLRGLKDAEGAEQLVAPLLGSQVGSRAWALVAEARDRTGDRPGALDAARRAAGAEPVAFEALLVHYRLTAGKDPDEARSALEALLVERPRNRSELEAVLVALRSADEASVERYGANLQRWDLNGYDGQLAEASKEIELVALAADDPGRLEAGIAEAAEQLRRPLPVVARALDRSRLWDRLAVYVREQRLPTDAPLTTRREVSAELRRAAARALTAGRTAAAETLAAHALALCPDDRYAQETWSNASDQLAVVRDGWRLAPTQPRLQPTRERAVLSVLAQSMPHTSGGYATRSHGVLTGLAALDWDVVAVTRPGFPYDRWPSADLRVVADEDEIDGIGYHRVLDERRRYPQYPLTSYVGGYADALEQQARTHGASLIHASSFYVNGLAAQAAAARLGVPFVYEMRGLEELMKISRDPSFASSERNAFLEHLETTICHSADRVFVITEALRQLMIERGVPASKLVVLPNGVHADRFERRPRDPLLEAQLGVAGKTVIGYAGGLVDYEGLDLLLEAVSVLRQRRPGPADFHLVVVGDGHVERRLHALASSLGVDDVVTFTGRVPHEEVARYLSLFDVAPFPRLPLPVCEAISPIKPFESMAMGKAVVVSSVAALTEIVTDGSTGLVFEKGSASGLARALELLLDSPELRRSLGESARAWVRAERDWSSIVKIVDGVYQELLEDV